MNKLTVIIPCKNESRNIRACIDGARGLADEILVADSGSTDDTLEIVRRIGGCRIVEREYVHSGDFKNWAIPRARHGWVLVLDADERLTPELRREIRELLANGPELDGYWIERDNFFMGHLVRFGAWGSDRCLRLFQRDAARYVGETDHAEVEVATGRVGSLRNRMPHYTCWTYDDFVRKQERYSSYQALVWYRAGRRPQLHKLFFTAFFRFLHIFFIRGGFRDGAVGFQVAMLIAYYSFQKQARLWQLVQGRDSSDFDHDYSQQRAA